MLFAPQETELTIDDFVRDPYPIYRKFRATTPVVKVRAAGRTMLTKAADTKFAKDNPELFSSDDPSTPMKKAFQAHTLMRKDGEAHLRDRNAMAQAFSPTNIKQVWQPHYEKIADDYIARLPKGETVDLFSQLAGPISARCLSHLIGLTDASDAQLCRWSQTLIDGAGNFAGFEEPFVRSELTNAQVNAAIDATLDDNRAEKRPNAISTMLHQDDPLPIEAIRSNIKIVIGGGINEPRDALCTTLYGLLTNPDQLQAVKQSDALRTAAFEEAIRWVAPIQLSS